MYVSIASTVLLNKPQLSFLPRNKLLKRVSYCSFLEVMSYSNRFCFPLVYCICTNDKNMQQLVGYSQHFARELYLQYTFQHFPNRPLYLGVHNSSEIAIPTGTWQPVSPLKRSFSCESWKKPLNGNAYAQLIAEMTLKLKRNYTHCISLYTNGNSMSFRTGKLFLRKNKSYTERILHPSQRENY